MKTTTWLALAFAIGFASTARAEVLAKISLHATDLLGVPISSIPVGGQFQLQAIVQDLRNPVAPFPGVFAAYLNASYDPGLATIATNVTPTFGPTFEGAGQGASFDFSTLGTIAHTGSFAGNFTFSTAELLLFRVAVTAIGAGTETFTPLFDATSGREVLLYGHDDPMLASEIEFVGTSLSIVPEPSSLLLSSSAMLALVAAGVTRRQNARRVAS